MDAVEVRELRKTYEDIAVVDGVSFSVSQGEVFSLLGPNGAGKTTTVEILEGHRIADSGEVAVLGVDPRHGGRSHRERVGIVLQEAGFEEDFTVSELVSLYRGFYSRGFQPANLIEHVGLGEKRSARVKSLSGGQRRRLDLALGLVGDPELLFLDEPTTGFDPAARRHAWELVRGLKQRGTTVVLTTHYLEEAEHLADRVAILVRGRLVALGTPAELTQNQRLVVVSFRLPENVDISGLPPMGADPVRDGAGWRLSAEHPAAVLHALSGWAMDRRLDLPFLEVRRQSLEDVYFSLVESSGGRADAESTEAIR